MTTSQEFKEFAGGQAISTVLTMIPFLLFIPHEVQKETFMLFYITSTIIFALITFGRIFYEFRSDERKELIEKAETEIELKEKKQEMMEERFSQLILEQQEIVNSINKIDDLIIELREKAIKKLKKVRKRVKPKKVDKIA